MSKTIFSFDIGWAFHGWAVKTKEGDIDCGVYAFEHDTSLEEYIEIKRSKKRKYSKNKRLNSLKKLFIDFGIFKSKKDINNFLNKNKHNNNMWEVIKKAHSNTVSQEEFILILYRFAKRRYYIDMTKKESNSEQKKDKEEGIIKKSLEEIEKIFKNLKNNSTYFEALFQKREKLYSSINKFYPYLDKDAFPYTNKNLKKLIENHYNKNNDIQKKFTDILNKDSLKKFDNEIGNYNLLLTNMQVAQSISKLAIIQREMGNKDIIFSEEFIGKYLDLLRYKGQMQSFEDKVGLCLSGNGLKRHPISSLDAENIKIAQFLNNTTILKIDNQNISEIEIELRGLGLDYTKLKDILLKEIQNNKNKKAELTANNIIKCLIKHKFLPKDSYMLKQFKHKDKPNSAVAIRLPGYKRVLNLSSEILKNKILKDDNFRDKLEHILLFYKDPKQVEEHLKKLLDENSIDNFIEDIKFLSLNDSGKPAACNNRAYRDILPIIIDGKDFQSALITIYPDSLVNIKRFYRKYLDFKLYKEVQKQKGINNPYLETNIQEFIFLFNRLIQKYGEAQEIIFETTREILSKKEQEATKKKIDTNEKQNRKIDEIISKYQENGQSIAKGAKERLKLFIEQGGKLDGEKAAKCIITGNPISIDATLDGNRTNTDHIIPQSWIHDNRLCNKILLDKNVNQTQKKDKTPIEYLISIGYSKEKAIEALKENIKGAKLSNNKKKYIFEQRSKEKIKDDSESAINSMDQRMSGIQNASVKSIVELIVDQYRFGTDDILSINEYRSRVLPVKGKMTAILRKAWLKDYKKDRNVYLNHAIDALVILNFNRSFLQKYMNYLKESYLKDENPIKIGVEKLKPTISDFKNITTNFINEFQEEKRVVVRREIKKYRGRLFKQLPHKKDKKNTLKVKNHFRELNSGFLKLIVTENSNNKRSVIKIHPGKKADIPNNFKYELYRYSLVFIKNKSLNGYFYIIGHSGNTIEVTPANNKPINRLRPTINSLEKVIKKLPINGKIIKE